MQKIMVASDLSERSDMAVERGAALAVALGSDLIVYHVVDSAVPAAIALKMKHEAEQCLKDTISRIAKDRDLTCGILVEVGDVVKSIEEKVADTKADLLVVGTHRKRVFLDEFRETTMERLIRCSSVPVLMVAARASRPYATMLGSVGLSRNCAAAIKMGCVIAPEAKKSLFHAHEVSFRKESELDYADWKAASSLPETLPEPMFVEAIIADAVHDLMADEGYELMTVGAHTRPGAGRLLLGSHTASLIRNPPCDLVVAK